MNAIGPNAERARLDTGDLRQLLEDEGGRVSPCSCTQITENVRSIEHLVHVVGWLEVKIYKAITSKGVLSQVPQRPDSGLPLVPRTLVVKPGLYGSV